eukprot:1161830-Pelagomonas_calceolata.AAC.7
MSSNSWTCAACEDGLQSSSCLIRMLRKCSSAMCMHVRVQLHHPAILPSQAKSAPSVPDTDGGGLHTCKASTYRPTNRKSPLTVDFLQKDPSSDSHSLVGASGAALYLALSNLNHLKDGLRIAITCLLLVDSLPQILHQPSAPAHIVLCISATDFAASILEPRPFQYLRCFTAVSCTGYYPPRVFTHTGASTQPRIWCTCILPATRLAPSSSSSLNDAASQHCTAMPTPQPHLRSTSAFNDATSQPHLRPTSAFNDATSQSHLRPTSAFNDATSQHRAAMPTPQPHLSSTSAFNPFEAAAAPTLAGQLHPLPAAHEFNPHLPSQQLYLPTRTQHVPFSEQPPSDYWKPGVHRAAAQGLGPQSSPSYAQPVQEGPFPSAAQPSMNGSQALPQSLAPPHPQASAQRGPAPPCHVVPAPPQLASTAAACLWQEFANSRAYCPYKNPGEWVALRM